MYHYQKENFFPKELLVKCLAVDIKITRQLTTKN